MTVVAPASVRRFSTLLAALALGAHAAAGAAMITVTTTADPGAPDDDACSLREAITSANSDASVGGCEAAGEPGADTIVFAEALFTDDLAARTILLGDGEGEFMITDTLTIDGSNQVAGEGSADRIGIDANGTEEEPLPASRIFNVQAPTTLQSLFLAGGRTAGDGGAITSSAPLSLNIVGISDSQADGDGGAIFSTAALSLSSLGISESKARRGGCIFNGVGGTVDVDQVTIRNCIATEGGGALWDGSGVAGAITIADPLFLQNRAGVFEEDADGNLVPDPNAAPANGGALYLPNGATITSASEDPRFFSANIATGSGGAIWNAGTLTAHSVQFLSNSALGDGTGAGGGQIYNDGASVTLTSVTLDSGQASGAQGSGGGVLSDGGDIKIDLSAVTSNFATSGGGAIALTGGATATITRSLFTGNGVTVTSDGDVERTDLGGAIYADGAGDLAVSFSSLTANQATTSGGAIWLHNTNADLTSLEVRNNSTGGDAANEGGGGLYLSGSSAVTITNSRFLGNAVGRELDQDDPDFEELAAAGGAILNDGGTLEVRGSLIARNFAALAGAGIQTTGGSVSVIRTVLGGDDAADGNMTGTEPGTGGGLHVGGGTATIQDSTVAFNTASEGGGIWVDADASLTVSNSTLSNNQATGGEAQDGGDGGGLYQVAGGSSTLIYTTVAGNSASGDGGGLAVGDGTAGSITLESSIVAGNSAEGVGDDFIDDGIVVDADSVVRVADAGLEDLRVFGGPTPTHPLTAASPALDIGDTSVCTGPPILAVDQRGAPRPFDAADFDGDDDLATLCDAGSFERNPELPVLTVSSNGPERVFATLGEDLVVLAFELRNDSDSGVTVAGFSARPLFNDTFGVGVLLNLLPVAFEPDQPLVFEVVRDVDGDGILDENETTVVGQDVADLGFEFEFAGGVAIAAGTSESYLVVFRAPADTDMTAAGPMFASPVYAGGMLLALVGIFGLRGLRQRTRWILAIAVLALGLTACSNGDNPPPEDPLFFGDRALQGQLRFKMLDLDGAMEQTVIGDGLPVYGPAIFL